MIEADSSTNTDTDTKTLSSRYTRVRKQTEALCIPLAIDDYGLQAMAETSPPKWHLAHTTWFFETFLLKPFAPDYQLYHPQFEVLFNSYYNSVGAQFPRPKRGLLSRPTVDEIYTYRQVIDERMQELLANDTHPQRSTILNRVELGLQHEQQHQELLLTDIKYGLFQNPLLPRYHTPPLPAEAAPAHPLTFSEYSGGLVTIGQNPQQPDFDVTYDFDFAFDNETPRHQHFLQSFSIADRLVTNGEYLAFINDHGYQRPELWLSDGWAAAAAADWHAPLYWIKRDGDWYEFTLSGLQRLDPNRPVCHVSFYEAEAYARWTDCLLPGEEEWEHMAASQAITGNFVSNGVLHPKVADKSSTAPTQIFGDVWEWTRSSYAPYPGYVAAEGSLGEYNGKFMCNQMVLRGGSCATDIEHIRPTYRNFFYPGDRWQFSGIRLARPIK